MAPGDAYRLDIIYVTSVTNPGGGNYHVTNPQPSDPIEEDPYCTPLPLRALRSKSDLGQKAFKVLGAAREQSRAILFLEIIR